VTETTTPAPAPQAAEPPVVILGRSFPYKYLVAVVYVAALFIDILDITIVNVALPAIGRDLGSSAVEWVVLGYTLSLAVWIPASGWLSDRVGTKRVFTSALVLFVIASMLCGLATSIGQLIAFRLLQGVGGGMLTPVGVAMLYRAFPPAERAKAATVLIIPTVLAPALGPILGGLLVTSVGWRWIFYINLPIGLLTIAACVLYLREHREPTDRHVDVPGFVLSGAGLALVVFALSEGPRSGWGSTLVLGAGTAGALAFVVMVWWELRIPHPMLDLRLLQERMFRNTNIVGVFSQAGFLGLIFLMPLYLQNLRGFDALDSGLATFPQAIGVMVASQIAGRLYPTVGPRRLVSAGLLSSALVVCAFLTLDMDTGLWTVRWLMFLRGITMGFTFVPLQAASYARIAPADNGRASSIFATQRQMSISVGIAVLATVLASYTPLVGPVPDPQRALDGFHAAFLVTAAFAAVGAVLALLIHDRDAANTMRSRA
jgi:EmrB/QacA subfamily drug resistance transporter